MRILAVSDVESNFIWEHFDPEVFRGVDLIISCGDLKSSYLQFLVSMIPAPLFYIHGNHDGHYMTMPPLGCISIDGLVAQFRGLRIGGLGGCRGTRPDGMQYTEIAMARRVQRFRREIKRSRGLDVFVTHAPPTGFGSEDDEFHAGFDCFRNLTLEYEPDLHLYGHVHLSGNPVNKHAAGTLGKTSVVNCTGYRFITINN
ncbi:MAG: metallophosphoesterase [Oscillospiraceae bacterium]|nr:metallophosphoesterase [Oscillospiraceae bacterium]